VTVMLSAAKHLAR